MVRWRRGWLSARCTGAGAPGEFGIWKEVQAIARSEATAMTKSLIYTAPIALIALMAPVTPATAAVWTGTMARDIAAATVDGKDTPLVLVRAGGGRGGGGGARA